MEVVTGCETLNNEDILFFSFLLLFRTKMWFFHYWKEGIAAKIELAWKNGNLYKWLLERLEHPDNPLFPNPPS